MGAVASMPPLWNKYIFLNIYELNMTHKHFVAQYFRRYKMAKKIFGWGILAVVLVFGMAIIGCDRVKSGGSGSRDTESNLVGIWELEDIVNVSRGDVVDSMEIFNDGTGIMSDDGRSVEVTWQLRDGSRLQTIVSAWGQTQISDFELSENGTLLTFHYSGRDYDGERPQKGIYRKKVAFTGDTALNGTWVNSKGDHILFNNGNFETSISLPGIEFEFKADKGFYSTNGSTYTSTITHLHGLLFSIIFKNPYLDERWYMKGELLSMRIITEEEAPGYFWTSTSTYSISGNTLTFTYPNGEVNTFTRK